MDAPNKWTVRVWYIEFELKTFEFEITPPDKTKPNQILDSTLYAKLRKGKERIKDHPLFFKRTELPEKRRISLHRKDNGQEEVSAKKTDKRLSLDPTKFSPERHEIYLIALEGRLEFQLEDRRNVLRQSILPVWLHWDDTVMTLKTRLLEEGKLSDQDKLTEDQRLQQGAQSTQMVISDLQNYMAFLGDLRSAELRNQFPHSLYVIYGTRSTHPTERIMLLPTQKFSETLLYTTPVYNEIIKFHVAFGTEPERVSPFEMPVFQQQQNEPQTPSKSWSPPPAPWEILGRKPRFNKIQT